MMAMTWSMALVSAATLTVGCGDETVDKKDGSDVPLFDTGGELPDVPQDSLSPTDATAPDSTTAVTDTTSNPPDLVPDMTPPKVIATTPAAGAEGVTLPLTITITFDEAVFGNTIAPQSVKLLDWLGAEVPGTPTLGADGKTVTWRPTTNDQQLASAYTIHIVGNIITDLAGNRLTATSDFTFTTQTYPSQEPYAVLAAKYAPTIHAPVASGAPPQYNIPTKFDSDGDWNLDNNRTWIISGATQVIPAVYYSVVESFTHYFIQYGFYFPYVNHPTANSSHTNAMYGVMVVVEKAHGDVAERPIVAYNYWKESEREEMLSFSTEESNIAKDAESPPDWGVVAEFPQATLFPDNRLQVHVAAGTHRTCLWGVSSGNTTFCEFNASIENGDALVFEYLGNSPTPVVKVNNTWPSDMSDVDGDPEAFGYTLVPIFNSLWPRRFETGEGAIFEPTTMTYTPASGRPGANLKLTSKFRQSLTGVDPSAFGNPIWAWKWAPGSGGGTGIGGTFLADGIVKGELAMDPAFYVWARHHRASKVNGITDYVPAAGSVPASGFALDYCFDGYLNIDVRTTNPACVAPAP